MNSAVAQTAWSVQSGQRAPLSDIQFTSPTNGFAVGDGVVLHTTNGGFTWLPDFRSNAPFTRVVFFDADTGYISSVRDGLLRTTNGGLNWNLAANWSVTDIGFSSRNVGVVVTDNDAAYSTLNGGQTWISSFFVSGVPFRGVSVVGSSWTVVGVGGTILRYRNWGAEVSLQSVGGTPLYDVYCRDTSNGIIVGTDGLILRTTNGGSAWTSQSGGTGQTLTRIAFTDSLSGTVVGVNGTVLRTSNGGTSWTTTTLDPPVDLMGCYFRDSNNGFIVGASGEMFVSTNGGLTWVRNTGSWIPRCSAVSSPDPNTGIAVGERGAVLRTTDGGTTWVQFSSGVVSDLYGLKFTDISTGTAVGDSGKILHTTNGGSTWTQQYSPNVQTRQLRSVDFINGTTGCAVGETGTIVWTTNGGTTWSPPSGSVPAVRFLGVALADANSAVAVGESGAILRTTNGGSTWVVKRFSSGDTLYSVSFSGASRGFAVGNHLVLHTTDGGESWTQQLAGTALHFTVASYIKPNNAIIAGSGGTVLRTTDDGRTWISQPGPTPQTLRGVSFSDSARGFIVGDEKMILRTTTGGFIINPPALSSPQNVSTGQDTTLTVRWHSAPYATSYRFQLASYSNFSQGIVLDSTLSDTSLVLRNLQSRTYFWRVKDNTPGGQSAWSEVWAFSTINAPIVQLVSPSDGAVALPTTTLRWRPVPGAVSYHLQGTLGGQLGSWMDDSALTDTFKVISTQNVPYEVSWRVMANGSDGQTLWSRVGHFEILPFPVPIPEYPPNGTFYYPIYLTLRWRTAPSADSYRLQVSRSLAFTNLVFDTTLTDTFANAPRLRHITNYYWRIASSYNGQLSEWSSAWSFTTDPFPEITVASPPDGATGQPTSVTLRWHHHSDVTLYTVIASTVPNDSSGFVLYQNTADTSSTLSGLAYNTTYYWRVTPFDDNGFGVPSAIFKFTTSNYPSLRVEDLQKVSPDDLLLADSLQNSIPSRWTIQASPRNGDSVSITARCVSLPGSFDLDGSVDAFTIADTGKNRSNFSDIIVNPSPDWPDRYRARTGHIITMNGRVTEMPAGGMNSQTVFELTSATIVDSTTDIPAPFLVHVSDFYKGAYPGGKVMYSSGEQYEGAQVELHNLTVQSRVDTAIDMFEMADESGNTIAAFSSVLRHNVVIPPVGSHIKLIRGVVMIAPGNERARGYALAYSPGNLVIGNSGNAVIEGISFDDLDGDGNRDVGEPVLAQWPVQIDGKTMGTGLTDPSGKFIFTDLDSGTYTVSNGHQAGWVQTTPGAQGSYTVTLGVNDSAGGKSFGNYYRGSVAGGQIFDDVNENGLRDSGEVGLRDWLVKVEGSDGFFSRSTLTDTDGIYSFIRLPPGMTHRISKLPIPGWDETTTLAEGTYLVNIGQDGQEFSGNDFGVHKPPPRVKIKISFGEQQRPYIGRDVFFGVRSGAHSGIWGVDPQATSIDSAEGEFDLPTQSTGLFDCRLVDPKGAGSFFFLGSWTDMRNYISPAQIDTYRVSFQPWYQEYPAMLRWSKYQVRASYNGAVTLRQSLAGSFIVDMKQQDSLPIASSDLHDLYLIAGEPTLPSFYRSGWYMVSVPAHVPDGRKSVLFPGVNSQAFFYDPQTGYMPANGGVLTPGVGYFVKFYSVVESLSVSGVPRVRDTVDVMRGWNMIGSLSVAVGGGEVLSIPPGMSISHFFGYEHGYFVADTLEPMQAYWIKVSQDGKLVLSSSSFGSIGAGKQNSGPPQDGYGRLHLSDRSGNSGTLYFTAEDENTEAFSAPPSPPAGSFDVRYSNQSLLASAAQKKDFPVLMTSAEYPVTVTWTQKSQETAASLVIDGREIPMGTSGRARISSASSKVSLRFTRPSGLPREFALEQNYPNPFNPTTVIRYQLPAIVERSVASLYNVSLKIYDLLGQEVATLVDGVQDAGYKSVEWKPVNGAGAAVSSGVYFYRLEARGVADPAGAFIRVRKMLLIR